MERVRALLQRVHPESHVHAGAIGEEGGQGGLLEQPKDQDLVPKGGRNGSLSQLSIEIQPHGGWDSLHALLEDGVPPGLADDQVGPLDDDDAGEEGRVTGELHDLSLLVRLQKHNNSNLQ